MSGWETREKGMENNKRGWGRKKAEGPKEIREKESEGAKENKDWGKTGGISDFHCAVPADSSWECASESPHAHSEAALSQLMGSDGFCPRLTCTVS